LDASILNLLQDKYPRYYVQLVEPELGDDGFQLTKDKRTDTRIATWLQSISSTSPTDDGSRAQMPASTRAYDIFSLKYAERLSLYLEWKEEIVAQTQRSLLANLKAFEKATAEIGKIGAEVSHRILARANVIGVTAPDLARNLDLLRRLNSKVLLVEEAGEVLEAHLLTAMLPSIEHAILIGDHQMRPRPLNPRSQVKMDSSLFKRLARSKANETPVIRVVTLEIQHRMHPSISAVMRSAAYPDVRDSLEVSKYPEVSGMRHRLFWLDHREPEDSKRNRSDSISYTNKYEVDMVSALVRHLIRQGVYRACDIALLTPYHSQLREIHYALGEMRVQLSTSLHGLRLAKTDGFQGEEAKIVIVSLVRSNAHVECTPRTSSRSIIAFMPRTEGRVSCPGI
jgi:superfamily I DNA and/or RNA helicase